MNKDFYLFTWGFEPINTSDVSDSELEEVLYAYLLSMASTTTFRDFCKEHDIIEFGIDLPGHYYLSRREASWRRIETKMDTLQAMINHIDCEVKKEKEK